jgi:peptidoglycan/LPS O-acetylase OafA/YrhL
MNFTVEQFLSVFERYNQAVWPLQLVAYAAGVVLVVLALTKWKRASAVIFGTLAVMWAGMAVGYMWLYFADINKAAYLFGVIFLAQAVLLAIAAVKQRSVAYGRRRDARTWVGLALIVYAMVAYPLLGMAFGHSYPRAPMFGLVPCPTTIFTFGMLLLAARPKRLLLWLPLVWSVIGFFAAVKFGIREDVGLLLAGIVTAVILPRAKPATDEPAAVDASPQTAT